MKSVFLRRLLVVLVIAMLFASISMLAGYGILSRNTYAEMKLEELLPKAETVQQLLVEYTTGALTPEGFGRVCAKLSLAADAALFITNAQGNILYLEDTGGLGVRVDALEPLLRPRIQAALMGQTVLEEAVDIGQYGRMLVVGIPFDAQTRINGSIFLIKPFEDIRAAANKLISPLILIIAIAVPIIMLVSSWRVHRITEPLHEMSEVAIEIAKGNFNARASEDEIGEIGLLARALNKLCESLSQTIYQLRFEKSQLNLILSSLTDGVVAIDGVGVLTHYNPAIMDMFGVVEAASREELICDHSIWEAFDSVFSSGEMQTITYNMPNDRALWISISPVVTEDGVRTGVVGLFKDVTEMERLEKMRREYVANVSHELRTPLTAVRGLLEPLADGMVKSEEDRQRYYKIMLHEVLRLSRLITDTMTLSRLQSGTEYMELSRVDADELIRDMAQGYIQTAQKKGISVIVDAPDVPDALTDADRVEQVLVILLDNAMRYTPRGGTITLRVRNGDRLYVSVEDTGCGIPREDLPHIFERFYKVDKSRKEGGTGLGLSIALSIVEKLGESLDVKSNVGEGTRFTFTLKKFVKNAIALGPVTRDNYQQFTGHAPEEDGDTEEAPVDQNARKAVKSIKKREDAPYEIINPMSRKRDDGARRKNVRPK